MSLQQLIQVDEKHICTPSTIPDTVFRYVKPSHVVGETISDEAFQLRENRSPPEEYISFYHSPNTGLLNQLKHVEKIMCAGKFTFSRNGGLLSLSPKSVEKEVNATRNLIEFVPKKAKLKIGMHYLSQDPMDVIEAKTILAYMSSFAPKSSF